MMKIAQECRQAGRSTAGGLAASLGRPDALISLFGPVRTTRLRWRVPYIRQSLLAANCILSVAQGAFGFCMPEGLLPARTSSLRLEGRTTRDLRWSFPVGCAA